MRSDKDATALRVAALCAVLLAALAAPVRCQGPGDAASVPRPRQGPRQGPRGRLLKVPKVYNALITSNEPLLPSRTEQATVGQVLYYPPQHHHGYPASSGPLVLPQVSAQAPPLYDPGQAVQQQQQQPLVSLPEQAEPSPGPPLEVNLQDEAAREQVTPWPVVYASEVEEQQQQQQQPEVLQRYTTGDEAPRPPAAVPFPDARAVQTVERVSEPGRYQPPPAVDIDSIKNNRPTNEGIRDVPPPPLPVGRGRKPPTGPQPLPPGILPF